MAKKIKKQRSAVNNLSSYSLWEGGTKRRQAKKAKEKHNAFCSLVHVHFPAQNPATDIFVDSDGAFFTSAFSFSATFTSNCWSYLHWGGLADVVDPLLRSSSSQIPHGT